MAREEKGGKDERDMGSPILIHSIPPSTIHSYLGFFDANFRGSFIEGWFLKHLRTNLRLEETVEDLLWGGWVGRKSVSVSQRRSKRSKERTLSDTPSSTGQSFLIFCASSFVSSKPLIALGKVCTKISFSLG